MSEKTETALLEKARKIKVRTDTEREAVWRAREREREMEEIISSSLRRLAPSIRSRRREEGVGEGGVASRKEEAGGAEMSREEQRD